MSPLLALGAGSAAALTTFLVLRLWLRFGRLLPLDVANARSLHVGAVPRIGGAAMAPVGAGILIALMAIPAATPVIVAVAGAAALFLLSLADDWRPLPVAPRLLGHLAAAAAAVAALGLPWAMAVPATLALVWMTNLYNFMDGADGLAGGMALLGFAAYGVAAQEAGLPWAWACFALAGSAGGFLAVNFPPARVFLGDAGSIPLGFLAGALGLAGWQAGAWPGWFPLLVFSPFVSDASFTLLARLLRGERVWEAHRDHCYQRLVRSGWSHRRLALAAYALMLAAAVSAVVMLRLAPVAQAVALACWAGIYGACLCAVRRRWRRWAQLPVISGGPGGPGVV